MPRQCRMCTDCMGASGNIDGMRMYMSRRSYDQSSPIRDGLEVFLQLSLQVRP